MNKFNWIQYGYIVTISHPKILPFLTCFSKCYHQTQTNDRKSANIIIKQQFVLRPLHRPFQSELFTQYNIKFTLSISLRSSIAAYFFFLDFTSLLSLFQQQAVEVSSCPRCDQSSWSSFFIFMYNISFLFDSL